MIIKRGFSNSKIMSFAIRGQTSVHAKIYFLEINANLVSINFINSIFSILQDEF